ncbi:tRNA1(Val) (adenine(37)-N6)-methyltransferase [Testudinibacter sp. P27/CKL/0425]
MAGFQFKQFFVAHDRCGMKVGTDSILLGAWAEVRQVRSVLDMGCGSGLLALMLAQRLAVSAADYHICALEIDSAAAQQARENIDQSPWADRIELINQDLADYARQAKPHFDLIISNPPYFAQGVECGSHARQTARYTAGSQGHLDWLLKAQALLNPQGRIAFVLPYAEGETLLRQLHQTALYCSKRVEIITKTAKPPQRLLLEFRLLESAVQHAQITIYQADNQYHPEFIALTRDFYLKF